MAKIKTNPGGLPLFNGLGSHRILQIIFLILCTSIVVYSGSPEKFRNGFVHAPVQFSYFEDSEVILFLDSVGNVHRSTNEGGDWQISDIPRKVAALIMHPFEKKDRAFALTLGNEHYRTTDKGATWEKFTTEIPPAIGSGALSFHAERSDLILFRGTRCSRNGDCNDETYYTENNFNSYKLLLENTDKCIWARSTKDSKEAPVHAVFCIRYKEPTDGTMRQWSDYRLVVSDDYFKSFQAVNFNSSYELAAMGIGIANEYLVVAVKNVITYDVELFVSKGGQYWKRAIFPLDTKFEGVENAYTILQSAPYHLVIDVLSSKTTTGKLFISNSDGEYFVDSLDHTNRNSRGYVDFEKVQSVDGILLANVVDNWHEVDDGSAIAKRIRSKISFEDGKNSSWKYIKPPDKNYGGVDFYCSAKDWENGGCSLHLHSITTAKSFGFVYSSPSAPGFLMGVGNVGSYLFPYEQCDTFLSTDGGLSWKVVKPGPYKYEFGDMGSLIVMVDDKVSTDVIWYSSNYGENWDSFNLGRSVKIRAKVLTSDPKSTSQNFILIGTSLSEEGSQNRYFIFKIIFQGLHDRQCKSDDFEKWQARKGDDIDCFMGQKTTYERRKKDAKCYVGKEDHDHEHKPTSTPCPCDDDDFECDHNFVLKDGKCVEVQKDYVPPGKCKKEGEDYWASSGYRLVPGNKCNRNDPNSKKLDEPTQKKCTKDHISPGDIITNTFYYNFDTLFYFTNSSVILATDTTGRVHRSTDDGASWKSLEDRAKSVTLHDHDSYRAYIFTEDNKLKYTSNRGDEFHEIKLPREPNILGRPLLDFHPNDPDWLLYLGGNSNPVYYTEAYFSKDNGKNWMLVETWAEKCIFGRDTDFDKTEEKTIFCSSYKNKNNTKGQDSLGGRSTEADPLRLISTKDFGKNIEVKLSGLVEYFIFDEYMAAATEKNNQLSLYISTNGTVFNEAKFPPDVRVDKKAYTLLESTTGSVFLDAYRSFDYNAEYGSLFKSNGDGTFFSLSLENTNRNGYGNVDFEKVQGMRGIILANVVTNTLELKRGASKKIVTMISFNDGSTWERLKISSNSDVYLNLHGRTDIRRSGGVFSKSSAVGLLIGVGNEGEYLEPYEQSKTYMSRDAGRTWTQIRSGESLYEFGDQGTIMAIVDDEGPTNKLRYSWDYGKNWKDYVFSPNSLVRVVYLTSNPKATSMKFLLTGLEISSDNSDIKPVVINVDFTQLEKRTCQDEDFELWDPMSGTSNGCFLGREVQYYRRKADRECKIDDSTSNMKPKEKPCACTANDFECDFDYFREDGVCKTFVPDPDRPYNCDGKYFGRSGYRKISESKCVGGVDLEKKVEKECNHKPTDITIKTKAFDSRIANYIYFNGTNTLIIRTEDNQVWRSEDEGYSWEIIPKLADVKIAAMFQNTYFSNIVYFITLSKTHYYTSDAAKSVEKMEVPMGPNLLGLPILDYHPDHKDWLIYTASQGCDQIFSPDCHSVAYYTKDNGKSWNDMITYVGKCAWARNKEFRPSDNLIFCESYLHKSGSQRSFYNNPLQFCTSTNFKNFDCKVESTVGFAIFEKYMVVAELLPSGQSLNLLVSLDGVIFASAQFPPNMQVTKEAFTILESSDHSIVLHVTTSFRNSWGNILKSNSNGTYYSLSLDDAYRDERGFVDFEKMHGIEGISMANKVINPHEVNMGGTKKLVSMISFNDGGTWRTLNKPERDSNDRLYDCDDCSLHLHSYTERRDPRDSFSSSSAVGLMMGVGNVGSYLTSYSDGNTFLTRDAGMTWREVRKGAYMHEFGNQGSILVIVDDEKPTDHILYSFDEGLSWAEKQFTIPTELIKVHDIATMPSGISGKFILRGRYEGVFDKEVIVFIDFTGVLPRTCELDIKKPSNDDFELWSPTHTEGNDCLFGHTTKYHRRILDRNCTVGENIIQPKEITKTCACTEHDFECDYNYIRVNNSCKLVPDAKPLERSISEQCVDGEQFYYDVSGYRKISDNKCSGNEENFMGTKHACPSPGHSVLFWVLLVLSPFVIVGIFTACVIYRRPDQFGYTLLGRIRLGESQSFLSSIPSTIMDVISSIRVPTFVSRAFSRIRPVRRYQYSPVATDDPLEVSLENYNDNE